MTKAHTPISLDSHPGIVGPLRDFKRWGHLGPQNDMIGSPWLVEENGFHPTTGKVVMGLQGPVIFHRVPGVDPCRHSVSLVVMQKLVSTQHCRGERK